MNVPTNRGASPYKADPGLADGAFRPRASLLTLEPFPRNAPAGVRCCRGCRRDGMSAGVGKNFWSGSQFYFSRRRVLRALGRPAPSRRPTSASASWPTSRPRTPPAGHAALRACFDAPDVPLSLGVHNHADLRGRAMLGSLLSAMAGLQNVPSLPETLGGNLPSAQED